MDRIKGTSGTDSTDRLKSLLSDTPNVNDQEKIKVPLIGFQTMSEYLDWIGFRLPLQKDIYRLTRGNLSHRKQKPLNWCSTW